MLRQKGPERNFQVSDIKIAKENLSYEVKNWDRASSLSWWSLGHRPWYIHQKVGWVCHVIVSGIPPFKGSRWGDYITHWSDVPDKLTCLVALVGLEKYESMCPWFNLVSSQMAIVSSQMAQVSYLSVFDLWLCYAAGVVLLKNKFCVPNIRRLLLEQTRCHVILPWHLYSKWSNSGQGTACSPWRANTTLTMYFYVCFKYMLHLLNHIATSEHRHNFRVHFYVLKKQQYRQMIK